MKGKVFLCTVSLDYGGGEGRAGTFFLAARL